MKQTTSGKGTSTKRLTHLLVLVVVLLVASSSVSAQSIDQHLSVKHALNARSKILESVPFAIPLWFHRHHVDPRVRTRKVIRTWESSELIGSMKFEGDFAPFVELLCIGEIVHVGQQSAFGLGRYTVVR